MYYYWVIFNKRWWKGGITKFARFLFVKWEYNAIYDIFAFVSRRHLNYVTNLAEVSFSERDILESLEIVQGISLISHLFQWVKNVKIFHKYGKI